MKVRFLETGTATLENKLDTIIEMLVIPLVGDIIQLKGENQEWFKWNALYKVTAISHIINVDTQVGVTVRVRKI